MVKLLPEILEKIEQAKESVEFLKTGFRTLDEWLDGGFLRKELIVLGAFTGIGKSYIAGQLMMNIARMGFKCAYFSLEISNEMLVSRMVGSLANIKPTRIVAGLLTPQEFEEKTKSVSRLESINDFLHFYDDTYELEKIIKEIKDNHYEFVVVDFIQNVMTGGNDEYTRMTRIALELQKAAKEFDCTILALSQLSNSAAREGSAGKQLEYKGSGAIAMVCDLGFFMERTQDTDPVTTNTVKLKLRKNRRGTSGFDMDLFFKIPGGWIYEE